jgi:hypothetical protein
MNRRTFSRIILWGGASTSVTRIFWPRPAESYEVNLDLRNFSASLVFSGFQRYSAARTLPGELDAILRGRSHSKAISNDKAAVIRQSDQVMRNNGFVQGRTELASAGQGYQQALLWGRQRTERSNLNPAFGFVQTYQGVQSDSRLSGPSMAGIHAAQPILRTDGRLSPAEVSGLLLPTLSTYEDRLFWSGENNRTGFAVYDSALGTVSIRYDPVDYRPGGRGKVEISAEGEQYAPRRVVVWVRFA